MAWKNIALTRGVAIFMVVLNHAGVNSFGIFALKVHPVTLDEAPLSFWSMLVLRNVTLFCVPAFFFASGFSLFRFASKWRAARGVALQIARKYLIWAVPFTAVFMFREGVFDPLSFCSRILLGSPFSAYWFLVVLVQLIVLSPVFVWLVKKRAPLAVAAFVMLQLTNWLLLYSGAVPDNWPVLIYFVFRGLSHAPFFIAGMLVSRHLAAVIGVFSRRRRLWAALTMISLAAVLAESFAWNTAGPEYALRTFSMERASQGIFSVLIIGWFLAVPTRESALRSWISKLGLASLGILLTNGAIQRIIYAALWRLPDWTGATADSWWGFSPAITLPAFLAAGIFLPLLLIRGSERLLGKRVRALW
ncbi:MAG: acyltransferase family protein [Planctomycetota bacterium]